MLNLRLLSFIVVILFDYKQKFEMSIILDAKFKTTPKADRQSKADSQSHLRIDIFLNQRINTCINGLTQSPASRNRVNRALFPLSRYLSVVTPAGNFCPRPPQADTCRRSSTSFRQMLMLSANKSAKARSTSFKMEREMARKGSPNTSALQKYTIHEERRQLAYNPSDFTAVRKQIAQKFERTKMILKEETKLKKYQKIQQIYDQKFKSLTHQSRSKKVKTPKDTRIDNSSFLF